MNKLISRITATLSSVRSFFLSFLSTKQYRKTRLQRYLQRKPGIRIDLVQSVAQGTQRIPGDITPDEMASVLLLLSATMPIDKLMRYIYQQDGWSRKMDTDFYKAVEGASVGLRQTGYISEAYDMFKIGEVLARLHNNVEWEQYFHREINLSLQRRISDMPFLKQRGW